MKGISKILGGAAVAALLTAGTASAETTIGVVVKIGGIPWFNAMEQGIQEQAEALGVDEVMVGPTNDAPALQDRAIEALIARGEDVIGVVPNDATKSRRYARAFSDCGIWNVPVPKALL